MGYLSAVASLPWRALLKGASLLNLHLYFNPTATPPAIQQLPQPTTTVGTCVQFAAAAPPPPDLNETNPSATSFADNEQHITAGPANVGALLHADKTYQESFTIRIDFATPERPHTYNLVYKGTNRDGLSSVAQAFLERLPQSLGQNYMTPLMRILKEATARPIHLNPAISNSYTEGRR